ncbi:MAG: ATPase, T2SS/T4P/T4SS family, partial [Vicinamibacterales bacterium]
MPLVDSLLTAIVRSDGDALVLHVGEKPYVVAAAGPVELSRQGLGLGAMEGLLAQLLTADALRGLREMGAVEHELATIPAAGGDRFTVIAARGGDDIWIEVRRHRRPRPSVPVAAPAAAVEAPIATADHEPETAAAPPEPLAAPAETAAPEVAASAEPAGAIPSHDLPAEVAAEPAEVASPMTPPAVEDETVSVEVEAAVIEPAAVESAAPQVEPAALEERTPAVEPMPAGPEPVPFEPPLVVAEPAAEVEPAPATAEDTFEPVEIAESIAPETWTIDHVPAIDFESPIDEPAVAPALEFTIDLPAAAAPVSFDAVVEAAVPPVEPVSMPFAEPPAAAVESAAAASPGPAAEPAATPAVEAEPAGAAEPEFEPVAAAPPVPVVAAAPPEPAQPVPAVPEFTAPAAAAAIPPTAAPASATMTPVPVSPEPPIAPAAPPVEPYAPRYDVPAAAASPRAPMPRVEPAVPEPPFPPIEPQPTLPGLPPTAFDDVTRSETPADAVPGVVLSLTRDSARAASQASRAHGRAGGIERLLRLAAARGASALYLTTQARPAVRVDGDIRLLEGESPLSSGDVEAAVLELAPEGARDKESAEWIRDLQDIGRVRITTFRDYRGPGALLRMISARATSAEQLGLVREIQALAMEPEGLVIVTGPRASGKSTMVSAFVDLINRQRNDYVITLEGQIRLVHESRGSLISQRELRGSAAEVVTAARAALRENPDVLIIEDLRSPDVLQVALDAAGSGLLVFASVTAASATAALERLVDLCPSEQRRTVRAALAEHLRGVVAQVLLRKAGGGRLAARELVLITNAVAALVSDGQIAQLPRAIDSGRK